MVSSDDNTQFMIAMLRKCGLAHKTVIFVLDEFDLFAQGKQRLLYSLLYAMQFVTSQAVVGVSCRLDADQLLEKRVRSRFSHRKLLFLPPAREDLQRFLEHCLMLPTESDIPSEYVADFNSKLFRNFADKRFKETIDLVFSTDSTFKNLQKFLFSALCHVDLISGHLTLDNFKSAVLIIQRHPKLECIKDCSVLELYILVCIKRMEIRHQEVCNFNSIIREYKSIHDSFQTTDYYARSVCRPVFEHLLQRELVTFLDTRGEGQTVVYRQVKLLISSQELHTGLNSHHSCLVSLKKIGILR